MGAATALLHADRDPEIGAICLDSSFASLRQLAEELASSEKILVPVPSWLIDAMLALIRMRVKVLADFDIEDLVPVDHAKRCSVPAIFLHARRDTFIRPGHSQQLYDAYQGGDKELLSVDGDHNSERNEQVVHRVLSFFRRTMRLDTTDFAVPSHIIDAEMVVPQRDGLPLRVPLGQKTQQCFADSHKEKKDKKDLPPPVAMRPLPSASKPMRGSMYEPGKPKCGPGGVPPKGDLDDPECPPLLAMPGKKASPSGARLLAARGGA